MPRLHRRLQNTFNNESHLHSITLASVLAASVGQIESKSVRGHVEQRDLETITPEQAYACGVGFFFPNNFDKFFRSDSTFTLAQTGVYKGVDGIKEYVKFGSPFSQYFSGYEVPPGVIPELLEVDGDICVFRTIFHIKYTFSDMVPDVSPFEVARMTTIYYDKAANYIPKINLYYTDRFLNFFWDVVSTPEVHGFICDLLANECDADGYKYDELVGDGVTRPSKQECVDALASLPTSDNGYATENNQGCRALHAIMATENTNHCPHIALNPTPDDKGYIKCNVYDNIDPKDLFDGRDFGAFKSYCDENGIHPVTGYRFVESV